MGRTVLKKLKIFYIIRYCSTFSIMSVQLIFVQLIFVQFSTVNIWGKLMGLEGVKYRTHVK